MSYEYILFALLIIVVLSRLTDNAEASADSYLFRADLIAKSTEPKSQEAPAPEATDG